MMLCTFAANDADSVYCVPAAETAAADTDAGAAAAPADGALMMPGSRQHANAAARLRFICSFMFMGSVTFSFPSAVAVYSVRCRCSRSFPFSVFFFVCEYSDSECSYCSFFVLHCFLVSIRIRIRRTGAQSHYSRLLQICQVLVSGCNRPVLCDTACKFGELP